VNTKLPSYFTNDEVEEGLDDDFDENPANDGAIALVERPLADDPIDTHLPN
jgi:hypothetical protein